MLFKHLSAYPCSAEELYNWHSRPGALERLLPPWEDISVLARKGGIEPGGMVELKMHAGPFPYRFVARHIENIPGEMFRDIQEKAPLQTGPIPTISVILSKDRYYTTRLSTPCRGIAFCHALSKNMSIGVWKIFFPTDRGNSRKISLFTSAVAPFP